MGCRGQWGQAGVGCEALGGGGCDLGENSSVRYRVAAVGLGK